MHFTVRHECTELSFVLFFSFLLWLCNQTSVVILWATTNGQHWWECTLPATLLYTCMLSSNCLVITYLRLWRISSASLSLSLSLSLCVCVFADTDSRMRSWVCWRRWRCVLRGRTSPAVRRKRWRCVASTRPCAGCSTTRYRTSQLSRTLLGASATPVCTYVRCMYMYNNVSHSFISIKCRPVFANSFADTLASEFITRRYIWKRVATLPWEALMSHTCVPIYTKQCRVAVPIVGRVPNYMGGGESLSRNSLAILIAYIAVIV